MDKAEEILKNYTKKHMYWEKFHKHTKDNIETIQIKKKESEGKCNEIDETISTINKLTEQAQWPGYVKISPLCHIYATIRHTGDYFVHYNEEYKAVLTAQQTINYLERKKKDVEFDLEIYENQLDQLTKRLNIEDELMEFTESEVPLPDTTDMPDMIESSVGVAVKSGGLFEILETDNTPYIKNSKRISRVKPK